MAIAGTIIVNMAVKMGITVVYARRKGLPAVYCDGGERPALLVTIGLAALLFEGSGRQVEVHHLRRRTHVRGEVRHDPDRADHHQEDDQDAEGQRQHVVGLSGPLVMWRKKTR